jgi:hypothetical protein
MRIDYIFLGPDIGGVDLNRVIFLSDTRYYMQTFAAQILNGDDSYTFIDLDITNNINLKAIIYSSEQSNSCYKIGKYFSASYSLIDGGAMNEYLGNPYVGFIATTFSLPSSTFSKSNVVFK